MNYTFSSLHFEKCEIVRNKISFHINLLPCHASDHLKQVHCLGLEVIIFCLTIAACEAIVSKVSFPGFGPVFFCNYEQCKPLINLAGFQQGHPRFDFLETACCVHVAHGHRAHAKAFSLLQSYRRTHPSIHAASIILSHSSIIHHTHPSLCPLYLSAHRQGPMRPCACLLSFRLMCSRSLVYIHFRARPCFCIFSATTAPPAFLTCARSGQASGSGCCPGEAHPHRARAFRPALTEVYNPCLCCLQHFRPVSMPRRYV